ncbi:MAG: sulfite exporter TauE/SafE family protein [Bacillota bacterium]|nr:sulfite exporter TauE/SafE family protein [Bacillota bacterium]
MVSSLILLVIGVMAGMIGSVLGLGGAVIMLPAMQIFLGYDAVMAVGTTLLAVVFTSLSGALGHFKAGNVQVRSGIWVGCGGLMGVLVGSYVFKKYLSCSMEGLSYIMGVLFLGMAVKMGLEVYSDLKGHDQGQGNSEETVSSEPVVGLLLLGMVTGTLTGMLGIGGGFIMVPGMMWLFGASAHVAVGSTLLAMLPIATVGAIIKLSQGFVFPMAGLILGIGTAVGAQLGVKVSRYLSPTMLRILFSILFIILAFDYLYPLVNV